ncbi:FecCD family ABC transporter permease [Luteibacter aegosomatissinici]|uniref:FecCD family ABC transporter permease n=1 Tax=Luteibacter aegosomatissinici TaxID=2911539 RepID=UPI001FF95329|nr:iron ABC transporter permease [Luteibacter aegosomatissinici]UPG94880.1 iron ABC transporter permease [Luteibacter aegosomatissinici]
MNSVAASLPRRRASRQALLGALALLLLATATWSLTRGAMAISPGDVAGALLRWLTGAPARGDDQIILGLRLPRLLLATMVGAALATGGGTMQGLFRNPLADPGLIGVSAGAALGAVGAIVLGSQSGSWLVAAFAFVGGLLATTLVFLIGRRRPGVANLLLAGVAINAIAMAGVGLLTYLANENQLRDLTYWSLGSLGGASWSRLGIVAPWIVLPLLLVPRAAVALNALLLGEGEAALLGFRPERLQPLLVALVALSVGASVAFTGVIGFVGLVVPHLLRMTCGPDHRFLLPASALGGATLLVAADALARTIVAPGELPIGVLTALVGGPFFLWLLLRRRAGEALS